MILSLYPSCLLNVNLMRSQTSFSINISKVAKHPSSSNVKVDPFLNISLEKSVFCFLFLLLLLRM